MVLTLSHKVKKWSSVAGSFMVALSLGNFYTLGNLSPYITSYLRLKVQPGFTDSYMIWVNGFFMAGDGLMMAVGGSLAPKLGNRVVVLVGSLIFTGFSALSAYSIKQNFLSFCFTYGFLSWIGAGINTAVIVGEIMKWFPESRGAMSGFVVSGFGFGGFGLNAIQTSLVNPDNLRPNKTGPYAGYFTDEDLLENVPNLFWKSALIIFAVQLVAIPLIFTPPKPREERTSSMRYTSERNQIERDPNANTSNGSQESLTNSEYEVLQGMSTVQMLKTKQFYVLWFIFAFQMLPVSFFLTYYKNYGLTFISDDHFLSYMGAGGALVSCSGKILAGKMLDKTSTKFSLIVLSFGISASVQLLYAAQFVLPQDSLGSKIYYTTFFLVAYICVGGIYGIIAGVAGDSFGLKHCGANYGVLFTSQAIGSLVGAFIVQKMQRKLEWTWLSFSSVVFFSLASLFLCYLLKSRKQEEEQALLSTRTSATNATANANKSPKNN